MNANRFTVKRTKEGGAIVLTGGEHRATTEDSWAAADWHSDALYWVSVPGVEGARRVDAALLAFQYLAGGDTDTWEDTRPLCVAGTVFSGFCENETVPGSLTCERHEMKEEQ